MASISNIRQGEVLGKTAFGLSWNEEREKKTTCVNGKWYATTVGKTNEIESEMRLSV